MKVKLGRVLRILSEVVSAAPAVVKAIRPIVTAIRHPGTEPAPAVDAGDGTVPARE